MKKLYKAIFFDWDGTAVSSRKAPVDEIVAVMKPLLQKKIKLVIVSGTTYENIAGGNLTSYFDEDELNYLYLGLGRGALNYRFENGEPVVFENQIPDTPMLMKIHDVSYAIHHRLWEIYDFHTDIVFCRPNYCKIDLAVENNRGENLFMQSDEVGLLRESLTKHGIGGMKNLLRLAQEEGEKAGLSVIPTCDAKYLEVGTTSKSDNVDALLQYLRAKDPLAASECAFWGDEFVGIEESVYGSDSFMITEATKGGDFFDVSSIEGDRPDEVQHIGGGIKQFITFLEEQAEGREE